MTSQSTRPGVSDVALRTALLGVLALVLPASDAPAQAQEGEWSLQLEALFMEVHGHDQHVLTVHEIDFDASPPSETSTAVNLDTDSGPAYRGELQYTRSQWGWGVDFFWFTTSQATPDRTAAADGASGPLDEVVFEVADRGFTSTDPGEVLFYRVLEDTDLAVWTLDLYGIRTLAEKPQSHIDLHFGVRFGDFDNDYRAVVGIEDVVGTRIDASSNYGRMMGPLVGLAATAHRGRHEIEAYLGQSLLLGDVELSNSAREFTGPFDQMPSFVARKTFRKDQDVGIPVTDFRVKWMFRISDRLSLGAGANTSAWWDVPVPPGVIPLEDGDEVLHENTLVFFGLVGAVKLTF